MTTFVRVRQPNGHEVSLNADYVAGIEGLEVLDEPATDRLGRPLPATRRNGRRMKPRTTVRKAAAAKKAKAKNTQTDGNPVSPTVSTPDQAATPKEETPA